MDCLALWAFLWLGFVLVPGRAQLQGFEIIGTTTTSNVINGIKTDEHQIEVQADQDNKEGIIQLGDFELDVSVVDPIWRYNIESSRTVPKSIKQEVVIGCLVGSTLQYNLSQVLVGLAAANNAAARRLLEFDPVGTAIAAAALGLAIANRIKLDRLDTAVNDLTTTVNSNNDLVQKWEGQTDIWMSKMTNWSGNTDAILRNQSILNRDFQTSIENHAESITKLFGLQNDTARALSMLSESVNDRFNQTLTIIQKDRSDIEGELAIADQHTRAVIARVYDVMANLSDHMEEMFTESSGSIQRLGETQRDLIATVWNNLHRRQMRRLLSAGIFRRLADIPAGYTAFVSADRTPPTSDVTNPVQKRIKVECFKVNFVSSRTVQSTTFGQLEAYQICVYADSDRAMEQYNVPWMKLDQIVLALSGQNCSRRVVLDNGGAVVAEDPVFASFVPCGMYVEVSHSSCEQLPSPAADFQWRTAQPGLTPGGQSGLLQTSYCRGSITTDPIIPIRSFERFRDWYSDNICSVLQHGALKEFQFIATLSGSIGYFTQDISLCKIQFNLMYRDPRSVNNVFFMLMKSLEFSMPIFQASIYNSEVQRYGRLPNGIHYEDTEFVYTPTHRDGDGNIITNGASEAFQCTSATFNILSDETLPVYTIVPDQANYVTKQAIINTFDPSQSDPPKVFDYPLQTPSQNILLTTDLINLLPDVMTFIGEIDAANLYDVPEKFLLTTSDPVSRRGTLMCNEMPPGTTQTLTYEQQNVRTGDLYDPEECRLSANLFEYTRAVDLNGFPYCTSPGGGPDNATVAPPDTQIGAPNAPNSKWCNILKNFNVQKVFRGGRYQLEMSPKLWQERVIFKAPSGVASLYLGTTNCSKAILIPTGPTGLIVRLTWAGTGPLVQRLIMTPNVTGDTACTKTLDITLTGGETRDIVFPSCGAATITTQAAGAHGTFFNCFAFTSSATTIAVQGYTGVQPDITQAIITQNDETLARTSTVGNQVTNALLLMAQTIAYNQERNQEFHDQLDAAKAQVVNNTLFPPIVWTANATVSSLDDAPLSALIADIRNRSIADAAQNLIDRAAENERVARDNAIQADMADRLTQNEEAVAEMRVLVANISAIPPLVNYIKPDLSDGFDNFDASSVGGFLLSGPKAVYGLAGNILSGITGGLFGGFGLGSFFGNLGTFALWFAFFIALYYGGKFIYKKCKKTPVEEMISAQQAAEAIKMQHEATLTTAQKKSGYSGLPDLGEWVVVEERVIDAAKGLKKFRIIQLDAGMFQGASSSPSPPHQDAAPMQVVPAQLQAFSSMNPGQAVHPSPPPPATPSNIFSPATPASTRPPTFPTVSPYSQLTPKTTSNVFTPLVPPPRPQGVLSAAQLAPRTTTNASTGPTIAAMPTMMTGGGGGTTAGFTSRPPTIAAPPAPMSKSIERGTMEMAGIDTSSRGSEGEEDEE